VKKPRLARLLRRDFRAVIPDRCFLQRQKECSPEVQEPSTGSSEDCQAALCRRWLDITLFYVVVCSFVCRQWRYAPRLSRA
jgi:hypothetical protein